MYVLPSASTSLFIVKANLALAHLDFLPVDHLFNTLVRLVGVPERLRSGVCKVAAEFICDCDLGNYFDWRPRE